jgi:hypothetical protein
VVGGDDDGEVTTQARGPACRAQDAAHQPVDAPEGVVVGRPQESVPVADDVGAGEVEEAQLPPPAAKVPLGHAHEVAHVAVDPLPADAGRPRPLPERELGLAGEDGRPAPALGVDDAEDGAHLLSGRLLHRARLVPLVVPGDTVAAVVTSDPAPGDHARVVRQRHGLLTLGAGVERAGAPPDEREEVRCPASPEPAEGLHVEAVDADRQHAVDLRCLRECRGGDCLRPERPGRPEWRGCPGWLGDASACGGPAEQQDEKGNEGLARVVDHDWEA